MTQGLSPREKGLKVTLYESRFNTARVFSKRRGRLFETQTTSLIVMKSISEYTIPSYYT